MANELGIEVKGSKAMCFSGHDAKTPSLSFWVEKNTWKCFGCGLGGTTIDLVCEVLGLSTPLDGAKWIDKRFGVSFPASSIGRPPHSKSSVARPIPGNQIERVLKSGNQPDAEIYEWLIKRCPIGDYGYKYLSEKRSLSHSTIDKFGVCELRDPERAFSSLLKRWGIDRLKTSGLCAKNKFPSNPNNIFRLIWFRHSLLFPFVDKGRVEYIQARQFSDKEPRYIGLLGVRKPMFNVDELRKAPRKSDVYICEGVTDTLAAYELGLRAVGVLGASSFRNEWVPLFRNVNALVVPDNDAAGAAFRKSVQSAFAVHGRVVNSVSIGDHNDLSEVILNDPIARRSIHR